MCFVELVLNPFSHSQVGIFIRAYGQGEEREIIFPKILSE